MKVINSVNPSTIYGSAKIEIMNELLSLTTNDLNDALREADVDTVPELAEVLLTAVVLAYCEEMQISQPENKEEFYELFTKALVACGDLQF